MFAHGFLLWFKASKRITSYSLCMKRSSNIHELQKLISEKLLFKLLSVYLERATCLSPFCFLALQLSTLKTTLLLHCNCWILKNYKTYLWPDRYGMSYFRFQYWLASAVYELKEKFPSIFRDNKMIQMGKIFKILFICPAYFFKLIMETLDTIISFYVLYYALESDKY